MSEVADTLVSYRREHDRVRPQPQRWNELWNLLPERQQIGAAWEPSLPLILAAWWHSSNLDKMLRLEIHIQWANQHGNLEEVSTFLRNLKEEEWHHLGD